jgi:hypothetical protein
LNPHCSPSITSSRHAFVIVLSRSGQYISDRLANHQGFLRIILRFLQLYRRYAVTDRSLQLYRRYAVTNCSLHLYRRYAVTDCSLQLYRRYALTDRSSCDVPDALYFSAGITLRVCIACSLLQFTCSAKGACDGELNVRNSRP